MARTRSDGKWRAPDSLGYNEHVGPVVGITASQSARNTLAAGVPDSYKAWGGAWPS